MNATGTRVPVGVTENEKCEQANAKECIDRDCNRIFDHFPQSHQLDGAISFTHSFQCTYHKPVNSSPHLSQMTVTQKNLMQFIG